MAKLYIGTSGWVYSHWQGIFYPEDLPSKDKLKYFSQHFKTAEVNYSFYHLPRPSTYQNWYLQTPGGKSAKRKKEKIPKIKISEKMLKLSNLSIKVAAMFFSQGIEKNFFIE